MAAALGGVAGIEGEVAGAALEGGEQGGDEVGGAFEADGDEGAGAGAVGGEVVGEGVGALVELAVGGGGAAVAHGGGVGGAVGLVFDELVDAAVGGVEAGVAGALGDLGGADGDGAGAGGGVVGELLAHADEVAGEALDRGPVEQVGVVLDHALPAATGHRHRHRHIELRRARPHRHHLHPHPTQAQTAFGRVLDHQRHLGERQRR